LALAGAAYLFLLALPPIIMAVLVVATGTLLTGALHLDGLADTADGLGGGRTREDALRIMRDHAVGWAPARWYSNGRVPRQVLPESCVGCPRVSHAGTRDEHDHLLGVGAVPDSTPACDLVLPLLELLATDRSGSQVES
jgi:hypothetical protein